jgi:hypothetical protein
MKHHYPGSFLLPETIFKGRKNMERKTKHKFWLLTAAIAFSMALLLKPVDVKAALAAPTNLRQTDAYTTTFKVEWDGVVDAKNYGIQYSEDKITWSEEQSWSLLYKTFSSNISQGKTYYVRIRAYDKSNNPGAWSDIVEVNTVPGKITDIKQTNADKNSVTISYSGADGATGYRISYGLSSSDKTEYAVVTATSATISGLPSNSGYYVYVSPIRSSEGSSYIAESTYNYYTEAYTVPTKPTSQKVYGRSASKKQTYISFTATDTYADGYEIQICNEKGKRTASSTVTKSYHKLYGYGIVESSKAFNTAFQYRVRAYKTINGTKKYSDWTSLKRYIPGAVCKSPIKHSKTTGKLKWTKVKGATSYTVYHASTSTLTSALKWKAVAKNVKGTSANVRWDNSKTYNFYYVKTNKVKFGSKKYNSASPSNALDVFYTY